jgi:DNA gyrase/topoisomerase IV subunit B
MRPLIEQGHLYLAQPPLYRITSGKDVVYCWSDDELAEELKKRNGKGDVTRFKGLGEMNAPELATTTMQRGKRRLIKIAIEDAAEADRLVNVLMGRNAQLRREHLMHNINSNSNLAHAAIA